MEITIQGMQSRIAELEKENEALREAVLDKSQKLTKAQRHIREAQAEVSRLQDGIQEIIRRYEY